MRGELTLNNSSLSSEKDLRQASKSDFTQGSILGKLVPFMLPILGVSSKNLKDCSMLHWTWMA